MFVVSVLLADNNLLWLNWKQMVNNCFDHRPISLHFTWNFIKLQQQQKNLDEKKTERYWKSSEENIWIFGDQAARFNSMLLTLWSCDAFGAVQLKKYN